MGTISKEEAAWLAGVIDGEGCIQVGIRTKPRETLRPVVEVANICPLLINRVSDICHKLGLVFHIAYGTWRPPSEYLRVAVTGHGSIEKLLDHILPYLTTKKEQAQKVLEFIRWRKTMPYGGGRTFANVEIVSRYRKLRDDLVALHARRFCLQRLPRRASMPLDLSGLEVKV